MITLEKLRTYEEFNGDIDGWARAPRGKVESHMTDADWYLIDELLIMHPSFGLGIAASRTPNPAQSRLKSLMAHTAFGVGLYVSAVGMSNVLPVHG